ncbi:LytR/AlgR family response regulator transcription factor [Lacrimispora sp.]|uniref:LytR/AlgR family response regulator transcription factor n=1 Tax=Lacrimispora sp. TaxID=2719234 RepID=UPI00289743FF|nr:LytTR family DNA-binding domain-containing protein [Lacrimispora sp.]
MIKVAICDDDVNFTGKFEDIIWGMSKECNILIDIDVFFDGNDLTRNVYEKKGEYDLIFLDIEMKNIDGITAARKIREIDEIVLIIYITSYTSYAIAAYDVQPFQFLVKPVDKEVLRRYFIKACKKILSGDIFFWYKSGKDSYQILIKDILYFQSNRRIISIYKTDGSILKYYEKLSEVEARLKTSKIDFWRIHQSYLVNARYIVRISYDQIELFDGKVLFFSEDRKKEIAELYWKKVRGDIIE